MPVRLGDFSGPVNNSSIIHIQHPSDTERLQIGDTVEIFDRLFEWDNYCVRASTLEGWRSRGDDLCDEALEALFPSSQSSAGVDLLCALETKALDAGEIGGPASRFLEEASGLPPLHIAASTEQIQRAQAFFWSNAVPISTSLMHFSLAGGFASPRITRVLNLSSYLVPPARPSDSPEDAITEASSERTFGRLMETVQFILDVMGAVPPPLARDAKSGDKAKKAEHCMVPDAEGWRSTIRVRMLHGTVRRRILARAAVQRPTVGKWSYNVEEDGLPINQEDLAATLGSFSAAPLACMEQLGWKCTPEEKEDYIALWRHIGFYLGVAPDILESHFMSYNAAGKFLSSCVIHLLDFSTLPPDAPPPPTIPILRAVSSRPPYSTPLAHHMALTRLLLGDKLSDHLGVDQTTLYYRLRLHISLFVTHYPKLFGEWYPRKAWERRRVAVMQEGMKRVVRFKLGLRRTAFRPRSDDNSDLAEDVRRTEAVVPDMVGAKKLIREYRLMLLEMAMASASLVLLGSLGTWALIRRMLQ